MATVAVANAQDTILHPFAGGNTDGSTPYASLTLSGSELYGTTAYGTGYNRGIVFGIATNGSGYTVLHQFTGTSSDGAYPFGSLTVSGSKIYGSSEYGGTSSLGISFSMNTDGSGFTILHSFAGGTADGSFPLGSLTLSGSTLYGVTTTGGSTGTGGFGYGTAFKMSTDGSGYTILHNFDVGSESPSALTPFGSKLYGTTYSSPSNGGTVFSMNTDGSGYTVLHSFTAAIDGAQPSSLTLVGSKLYGVTTAGGGGSGTVFCINADGTNYQILYSFAGANSGSLIYANGKLYGTTNSGGSDGKGTIFSINLDGTGYTVLYSFTDKPDGAFGGAAVTASIDGSTLYGTTVGGGIFENGVVFAIPAFPTTGSTIQNAAPTNTSPSANFVVIGSVSTGGPTDNNTVNSLIFTPGGTLTIFNTLALTSGNVTTGGGTNSIHGGTLYGPNGLHFDVSGNLFVGSTLIGNVIKTGDGSLFLDDSLHGNMQVLQGLLGGNGSIFGNLFNAAIVSPGHSPGQIHVSGNYTQTPTGTLRIEIGGRDLSQHDLLSVGGTASLDGTLQLVRLNDFKLKRNKPVTFLTANGGVNGEFANVVSDFTSDTILDPTVIYHSNSVALEAVQGSFEKFADQAGLTPNQKSVARALDSAANDRRGNSLFDYIDYRKLDKLPGDLDKIAPEELTSIFTIGTSLANVQSGNIQRRTDDIRSGSSGFNAAGLALNGIGPSYSGSFNTGVAGPNGNDDGKDVKETAPVVAAENRWGAFLSGTGEWVSVGNTDNARGYDLTSGGFTLGIDYKMTPNFALGLAAGYTGTTADLTDRGRVWVNGGKIGLYATFFQNEQVTPPSSMSKDAKEVQAPAAYNVAKGFYADVAVFGGYNSYDTRRSALQGEARGDTDGGELNALAGIGYDFKKGNLTFGPTASFNYTYLGTNEFTEHGSLAPLDIHGGKGESLRTAFGLKASYDWKVGSVLIKPEIRAAWQHEFGDAAYALDSSFANGAGDSFLVNGPQLGRDSALLGAGFAIQCSERCSTYLYYDGELGRKNYQSTSVTGGVRISF